MLSIVTCPPHHHRYARGASFPEQWLANKQPRAKAPERPGRQPTGSLVEALHPITLRPRDAAAYLDVSQDFLLKSDIPRIQKIRGLSSGKSVILFLVSDLNEWAAKDDSWWLTPPPSYSSPGSPDK